MKFELRSVLTLMPLVVIADALVGLVVVTLAVQGTGTTTLAPPSRDGPL